MNQKNNKRLEFKLPESLLESAKQVAKHNNTTTSELVREGLRMAIKEYGE